jgi:hypothetical protein
MQDIGGLLVEEHGWSRNGEQGTGNMKIRPDG